MVIQFAKRSSVSSGYDNPGSHNNGKKYEGSYQFNKEQSYEGEFLRDSLHGQGAYKWQNVALYDGGFYTNFKEGYASISFPDSSYFEGLFVKNQPFGPGIFTHPNGRQDAGFWKGKKLVRLSRAVDFIIPRLAPTSAAKIKLLQFRRLIPVEEDNTSVTDILDRYGHSRNISAPFSTAIYDRRSIFFDKRVFEKSYFASPRRWLELLKSPSLTTQFEEEEDEEEGEEPFREEFVENPIPSHCICPTDVFEMQYEKEYSIDVCERESFAGENEMGILGYFNKYGTYEKRDSEIERESDLNFQRSEEMLGKEEETREDDSKIPKILSWNRNELCTEMLKQIFRFRNFEGKLNFNLSKLMVGARTAFRKTGENEMKCLQFLKMCSLGPAHVVKSLLCAFQVSEELMDARGNNSLMFAAATDKRDVIEVLLNYGVDLNSFNDEGLTPLNLCLLRRLAYAYGISNWETAFLPKEIDETKYENPQAHRYPTTESISSLDRIFGDGMSVDDNSIIGFGSAVMSSPMSPVVGRESFDRKLTDDKIETSKTTLIASPSKTQGSLSVINWEWEFRPGKSVSVVALSNPTPTLNVKIIPKSIRRDEFQRSLQRTSRDKYLFEISFEKNPKTAKEEESLNSVRKNQNKQEEDLDVEEETTEGGRTFDFDVTERIAEIDKTINLLLDKGADPNISEVPKPSLHLAVYTKDLKTVQTLLSHGANPNSVLHSNEGLLTPLHVIALEKPTLEFVQICDLLLNFKANPDKETLPGFSINEEEKQYLDPEQGRTPLHLLCMRPDLEYADPRGYLIRIALMLARACQKKHLYNGHSYLSLAMLFGNMKLLRAFLHSEVFDPNDILGKNRGTCLHVLVSGELQSRTNYDTSIEMCDLLIGAGADPLKTFKNPRSLLGTCVDYGYRELGLLREQRLSEEFRGFNRSFSKSRDSLKDHEKVIEYLAVVVGETAKLKRKHFLEVGRFQRYKPSTDRWKHRRGSARRLPRGTYDERGFGNFSSATIVGSQERMGKGNKDRYASFEERASKLILPSGRARMKNKAKMQDKKEVQQKKEEKDEKEVRDRKKVQIKKKFHDKEDVEDETEVAGEFEQSPNIIKGRKREDDDKFDKKIDDKTKHQKNRRSVVKEGEDTWDQEDKNKRPEGKLFLGKRERKDSITIHRLRQLLRKNKRENRKKFSVEEETSSTSSKATIKGKFGRRSTQQDDIATRPEPRERKKMKGVTDDETEQTKKLHEGHSKKGGRHIPDKKGRLQGRKEEADKKGYSSEARERGKKLRPDRTSRPSLNTFGRDLNAPRADGSSLRTATDRRANASEVFPEHLRQVLLRLYGNCVNMDVNEFLMPYVVLRDGQLYYKFKGKATKQKEQYSLI